MPGGGGTVATVRGRRVGSAQDRRHAADLCREISVVLEDLRTHIRWCSRSAVQVATSRVAFRHRDWSSSALAPTGGAVGPPQRRCEALVIASLHDKVTLELDEAFLDSGGLVQL
jgi:hypothetical protein